MSLLFSSLALALNLEATEIEVTESQDDGTGLTSSTLSWAILQANTTPGSDSIILKTDVSINGVMKRLIDSDVTLTSDTTRRTISGNNQFRPIFIKSGHVTLNDISITGGLAKGGDSSRADAGAGLGGALFVYGGQVTVSNVTISNSSAIGGESSGTGSCYSMGGGMFGRGMFDQTDAYGGYGLYQNIDPNFGSGGTSFSYADRNGGFGGGGYMGNPPYNHPGNGGFGAGGGTGNIYIGRAESGVKISRGGSCPGDVYYSFHSGSGGFGSGGGYGGIGSGAGMGGAVFIRTGNIRFEHTTISNNTADAVGGAKGLGGGIFVLHADRLTDLSGNNSGMPENTPDVSACRLTFENNTAKSNDASGDSTDDVFDVAQLINTGISSLMTDFCVSIAGNKQYIQNNDDTPNTADFTHFGSVALNSPQVTHHQFILKNHATNDTTLTNNPLVAISGDHPGDFIVTSIPDPVIPSDGLTEFEITFQPTQSGYRRAQVEIAFDDGATGLYTFAIDGQGLVIEPEIELRGDGQTIINGSLTPNPVNNTEFSGTAVQDDLSTQSFAIHNTGNDNLMILGKGTPKVKITGSEASSFEVSSDVKTSVITPDTSSSFEVTFDPVIAGQNSATVVIENNDPDESLHTFNISGTGLIPEIDIHCDAEWINGVYTPISVINGSIDSIEDCTLATRTYVNSTNLSLSFSISNEGDAGLYLTNDPVVELVNLDGDHFSIDSVSPETVIAPGESGLVRIAFNPTSAGPKTALVRIASNDEDEPLYEFMIHGIGTSRMIARIVNPENTVVEGEAVIFELKMTAPVDTDVVVNYENRVHSSFITQDDLVDQQINGQVTIPANSTRVPLYFEILADGIMEGKEYLSVRFSSTNELVFTSPTWISPTMIIEDGNYNQFIFATGFE